eukprot:3613604-Pleurochrysis_carterae.AAC.1
MDVLAAIASTSPPAATAREDLSAAFKRSNVDPSVRDKNNASKDAKPAAKPVEPLARVAANRQLARREPSREEVRAAMLQRGRWAPTTTAAIGPRAHSETAPYSTAAGCEQVSCLPTNAGSR